jgi:hypothetical protein
MAANDDEMAELIKEIAQKHHLSIGRNDPILVLQTINNRLLENSAKAQRELLEAFSSQLEAISQRWSKDAKEKADRALSASVNAATESALKVLQDTSSTASASVRSEFIAGSQRIAVSLRRVRAVAYLNLAASVVTLIAVVVLVLGFVTRH